MQRLTKTEIEKYANVKGVKRVAVINFLSSLDPDIGAMGNTMNMHMDAKMYKWNEVTVRTIEAGIRAAFSSRTIGKFGGTILRIPAEPKKNPGKGAGIREPKATATQLAAYKKKFGIE